MNIDENITHYLFQLDNVLSGLLTLLSLSEEQADTIEHIIQSVDKKLITWNKNTKKHRKVITTTIVQVEPSEEYKSDQILHSLSNKQEPKTDMRRAIAKVRSMTRGAPSKPKSHLIKHNKYEAYDVREWLFNALDCNKHYFKKYLPLLMHNRLDSMSAIKQMTEDDLIRIGIKKPEHRKKILSSIVLHDDMVSEASTFTVSVKSELLNESFYARAISNYNCTANDQLDLKTDALYSIIKTTPSGWWYATDMQGNHGWVPGNYLNRCSDDQNSMLSKQFTIESSYPSTVEPGYF